MFPLVRCSGKILPQGRFRPGILAPRFQFHSRIGCLPSSLLSRWSTRSLSNSLNSPVGIRRFSGAAAAARESTTPIVLDATEEIEDDTTASGVQLLPREVVDHLDRYIIGQEAAKKAVAIAFRNRWRRHRLDKEMREEIMPKNMLMVGPTGCGKTEIARRLAKLADAPFLKIEATKFTEIGFHGRDVDSIIRDLIEISITQTKARRRRKVSGIVNKIVEEKIVERLVSHSASKRDKASFLKLLRDGEMEDMRIDIDLDIKYPDSGPEIPIGHVIEKNPHIMLEIRRLWGQGDKKERRNVDVKEARKLLSEMESDKLLNNDDIVKEAIRSAEQDGIVFLDEIDKICTSSQSLHSSADASAEGVQRDLLPLIEGCTVVTKYGNIETDHIMFIASGAFHSVKPSDMMAELQGRLPIRVELKGLTVNDLERILKEPEFNLLKQEIAMMSTEGVELSFDDDAIKEIAIVAADVNFSSENIGARRLYHIVEKVIETISFNAPDKKGKIVVSKDYVHKQCGSISQKTDLGKFII
uniref:ATP-dependent HslUV protease ATP-binding subunit HslU n=1 Tax=Hirondellea gigas TaxID=1518452 RepID=A0A6A7FPN4_9CRUS